MKLNRKANTCPQSTFWLFVNIEKGEVQIEVIHDEMKRYNEFILKGTQWTSLKNDLSKLKALSTFQVQTCRPGLLISFKEEKSNVVMHAGSFCLS